MKFVKGMARPLNSGIKKGQTHGITFPKARAEIAASGKHPIQEIIKLIPFLEPKDQLKAWIELQSWIESKPKDDLIDLIQDSDDDQIKELSDDQLERAIRLVKAPDEEA